MTPRKLSVAIFTFAYGGNGATKSQHPDIMEWMLVNVPKLKADPRVSNVWHRDLSDTPITMTRNQAVLTAMELKADLILMVDSDMKPDMYLGVDPEAEPFLPTAFDFIYDNWDKGPNVVFAPYCGPPPHENVYCFLWRDYETNSPSDHWALDQYSRHEAAHMAGIQEVAAGPTGVILWDARVFEVTKPRKKGDMPWFYYEFTDLYHAEKGSTEDVTATRDISMACIGKYGRNPIHCHWSSWAGHWKPKLVGKPILVGAEHVVGRVKAAIEGGLDSNQKLQQLETDFADRIDWSLARHDCDLEPVSRFQLDDFAPNQVNDAARNGQ